MCNFLSAIVTRTGEIYCDPEYTDSHSVLIEAYGLKEGPGPDFEGANFVRVELSPKGGDYLDLAAYKFTIDESRAPGWWTPELATQVRETLERRIERMIVRGSRKALLGGCHILADGSIVDKVRGGRIVAMRGNSQAPRGPTDSPSTPVGES